MGVLLLCLRKRNTPPDPHWHQRKNLDAISGHSEHFSLNKDKEKSLLPPDMSAKSFPIV